MKETKLEQWQLDRIEYWYLHCLPVLMESFPKRIRFILNQEKGVVEYVDIPEKSLFLYGASGTGKTVDIYRRLLNWHHRNFVKRTQTNFVFVKVPNLLENLRNLINTPLDKQILLNELKACKLLILDDIGAHSMTDWATQILYSIIDSRYDNMKITWYTSNFDFKTLSEMSNDDRIVRRIANDIKDNMIYFTNEPFL